MIEAQDFLVKTKIQTIDKMKKQDRDALLKSMHRAGYPSWYSKKNITLTANDLAEKLAMRAKHGR